MAGVNKVIILGNLGRDPEVTYTQSGMAVCKFSLATSKKRKDGSEVTAWHRCTAFDKRGEAIGRYVNKGQQLYIEGELQYGQYEKDGITRYTTDIIVNQFSFVGSKGSGGGGGNQGGYNQNQGGGDDYYAGGQPSGGGPAPVQDDDDIPF
ncbi:MAG: single-stranded DNA-binding protein [Desulfobacterales bacterium]|nr:single-stranded DNA-binding protein [Desulfobacterales bacterium]MCP4158486.1 single-stranded DNA-binding protein [Deltaproteobacteria bacterium]